MKDPISPTYNMPTCSCTWAVASCMLMQCCCLALKMLGPWSHPGCLVEPVLPPAMVIQEVDEGGRQRVGLADPGVANLRHTEQLSLRFMQWVHESPGHAMHKLPQQLCRAAHRMIASSSAQVLALMLTWLVQAHMRAVSPCLRRVTLRSLRTAGGASGLLPQRTSSVMPRSRTYSARLWCLVLGLHTCILHHVTHASSGIMPWCGSGLTT